MIRHLVAFTAFLFVMGCAHFVGRDTRADESLLPPTAEQLAAPDAATRKNTRWWNLFRAGEEARKNNDQAAACLSFRELSREKTFPLYELSVLRAHEICPGTEDLPAPEALDAQALAWFEDSYLRGQALHFKELKDEDKIKLLWAQARLQVDDRQRELNLVDAVGIAEKSGNQPLITEARERLWKNSPRLNPKPAEKDLASVAADLRKWREIAQAVQIENQRLKKKNLLPEEKFQILKSIRQTWKSSQRKKEMLAATNVLLQFARTSYRKNSKDPGSAKRLLEARTLHARTYWTENRRDLALKSLKQVQKELEGKVSFEDVHFLLARLAEESGDLKTAEIEFANALKERPATAGLRDKIMWAHAWVLHKSARTPEALAAFDELRKNAKEVPDQMRATFWYARNLSDEKEKQTAFQELQKNDPLGYYGMMAARELKAPMQPIVINTANNDLSLPLSNELPLKPSLVAEWMISLNVTEGLNKVLESIQVELKKNPKAQTETWLRLASAYAKAGEYLPLFGLMASLTPEVRDRLVKERPDLLFPQPWREEVKAASDAAKVPQELIYAIIRQESAFNPRARSHAEAYGPMQLLPKVALALAKQHGVDYKVPEDLYNPRIGVTLGTYELSTLFTRWKGVWIPSVASYNASEDAVRGWLKVRHREDPLEFIEEIPYEETRTYVKLVMRNQVFYQRTLSALPTEFPENCLNLSRRK